jgi:hypothetical protein
MRHEPTDPESGPGYRTCSNYGSVFVRNPADKEHTEKEVGWSIDRSRFKGAQAWDIRERVFYTNQTCAARWIGDWRKNMAFRKLEPLFEGFRDEYLI